MMCYCENNNGFIHGLVIQGKRKVFTTTLLVSEIEREPACGNERTKDTASSTAFENRVPHPDCFELYRETS